MDETQVWSLLERGGVRGPTTNGPASIDQTEVDEWRPASYDPFADPAAAEALGRELAGRARELNPDVVLFWETPENAALAFVVGRELGTSVVRAFNMDGLVGRSGPLRPGSRVLIVADALRDAPAVRAMRSLAEQQGSTIAGAAVLLSTRVLEGVREMGGGVVCLTGTGGS
jgi:adenine/guanine phosphoribosyltransferase-like PRPP-binding protein